ncbi:MAG: hypothetical protein AAGC55_06935 [Myxococcota bacterium]
MLSAAMVALLGCNNRGVASGESIPSKSVGADISAGSEQALDVLMVISTAPGMAAKQRTLAAQVDTFVAELERTAGGRPDLHIGAISAEIGIGPFAHGQCDERGDNGALQAAPPAAGCAPLDDDASFIIDIADRAGDHGDARRRNYSGALTDNLACAVQLGEQGCSFQQPLEAMRRALNGSNPERNRGFLRDDAYLAVIFIGDRDDCSARTTELFDPADTAELGPLSLFRCFEFGVRCEPDLPRSLGPRDSCRGRTRSPYSLTVEEYQRFLTGSGPGTLNRDPGRVIVAAVHGAPSAVTVTADPDSNPRLEPACTGPDGSAGPAVRLGHFAGLFPQRNISASICGDQPVDPLAAIGRGLALLIDNRCIAGDIDLDPDRPGVQHTCVVSEVRRPGAADQDERPLAACSAVPAPADEWPCWHLAADPFCADDRFPTQQTVIVDRGPDGAADVPPGTVIRYSCAVR